MYDNDAVELHDEAAHFQEPALHIQLRMDT
jgi:hypothetical protein